MSSITFIGVDDKPYLKQVVDENGSKIIQYDQSGKENIVNEMKK